MKTIKTMIAALVLTIGTLTIANAQTRVHVSFNAPGVHVGVGNYHPYHYYAPAPVVYDPYYAPVYHRYYYGRPVVYRSYYRREYVRPVYHRVYRRW